MTSTRGSRRRRGAWAQRPWGVVRWIVLVGTVPSIVAFWFFATGADALWWVGGSAAFAALLASIRLVTMPSAIQENPYLYETARHADSTSAPFRRLGGDILWAALLWLVGTGAIAVSLAAGGSSDSSLLAAPLYVGLIWAMGVCVGAMFGMLLFYPAGLLIARASARRAGGQTHRGWSVAAAILLLLAVWGAAAIVAAFGITAEPRQDGEGRRGVADVLVGDVSSLAPEFQIAAWIARVTFVIIVGLMVYVAIVGTRDRRRAAAEAAAADPAEDQRP